MSRLIRTQATGSGQGTDQALAARLIGEAKLASWAGLWERVAADKAEVDALNLDRKAFILETFSRLEALARS